MKLRTGLFQLVAGTVIPLVLLAITLGALLATEQQDTFRDGALARIRAFMTAVDAELLGHIRAARALAATDSLVDGDLAQFYSDAARVLQSQEDWQNISLASPDGVQLINLAQPLGTRLPAAPDAGSFGDIVDSMAPAVGNVYFGEFMQQYGVPVRVPVVDAGGRLAYVLTAVVAPAAFGELIRRQNLPPTWVSGLIDAAGRFVGRVPALTHEDLASEDFRAAIAGGREGWYRGLTVERVDTYTAFKVSDVSQWSAGIAIPASVVNAGLRNAAWIIVFGTMMCVSIALGFAYFQGRRIARPIARLAASARAIGRDGHVAGQGGLRRGDDVGIHEVGEVARALEESAQAIAERRALLERERLALREADRAKDEFLAMLGHELRNPLGAITTAAQVLRVTEPGGEVAQQSLAIVERQTRQMTRLIDDLLDISGVTMGKVELDLKPLDLARFTERVIGTWERSEENRGNRVALVAEPVWVEADRVRLEQVLSNLLDNARKYSPENSAIRVTVSTDGTHANLVVADEGEGIAADQLESVFGLFVQGAPVRSRLRSGLGVGLALVKRLVEMHGGTVEAASAGRGQGATFSVRLPATPAPPAGEAVEAPADDNDVGRRLRIIVTEDNDDARAMLSSLLALDGHEVRVARQGTEALELLAEWVPDVVIMDIGLPDMDGYEVARRIGETDVRRQVKLIALTGFGQIEDERSAYDAGFDLHITKPVTPDTLRKALTALTRG